MKKVAGGASAASGGALRDNMDLSIQLSYDNAVALEHIPAESDGRTFEVEEAWFLKLLDRPDLVAWIQSPLS